MPHWPQDGTPVGNERTQNRWCVTVWDSRFSWLFVYVRGMMSKGKQQTTKGTFCYLNDTGFEELKSALPPLTGCLK